MAKNSKKKSKKETITILKIDYDFLIAQNEQLKKTKPRITNSSER